MNYQDLKKYQDFYEGSIDVIRKGSLGFVIYLFRHHKIDLYSHRIKRVLLNELTIESEIEGFAKRVYDGYSYLINNARQDFSMEILKPFFYLCFRWLLRIYKNESPRLY